jgi:alpha-galactosidase
MTSRIVRLLAVAAALAVATTTTAAAGEIARTPPLGWNSWDAYGFTINESDFKANVMVLAGMKGYGWKYAVIDEGWYMDNPFGESLETRNYVLDAHGLLAPVASRFPSATHDLGLKPLADWVHAQGLKFGIHIVRGIPKQAVRDNLPIAGSTHRAAEAADTSDTCPWDDGNYGVSDTPAGQAYYDSMFREYARWGLDFIKVDCIADHPYKGSEIRQIAAAIKHAHRPMVLSLSPGPANLSHAAELGQYANMWRISNDVWDGWTFYYKKPDDDFPNGVATAFDNLARWSPYAKPGNWPDADMLPIGSLEPHPGWGDPRTSRLTQDEQRTQWTLWAIARSPLIVGANLTQLDEFTRSLMTNEEVLEVNQNTDGSRPIATLPPGFERARVWVAHERQAAHGSRWFVALFNLDNAPVTLRASWSQLNIQAAKSPIRNVWDGLETPASDGVDVTLPAHGCALYRIEAP